MKTYFYNRTVYGINLLECKIPQCFYELDSYFDMVFAKTDWCNHISVTLAENLCHRLADVELYAHFIKHNQNSPAYFGASILIGTMLTSYFNSCKSFLDACSITLSTIYNLEITKKQMDFSKKIFWDKLENSTGENIVNRYTPFKDLFKEIVKWRDSATHRITPFVLPNMPGDPVTTPRDKIEIKMINSVDIDIAKAVKNINSLEWVDPLYYHLKWKNTLIELSREVCLDIRSQTF